MDSGAGVTWRWSAADTAETRSIWKPVPKTEATLLEHALLQAWSRIELTIDGTPYVIDPFFPDAEANIATPIDNLRGPVLLFARGISVAAEQLVDISGGKPGLTFAETLAEATSQAGSSVLASQQQEISSFTELTSVLSGTPPSADSAAALAVDCEGFRLVRRRGRRKKPAGPVANVEQQSRVVGTHVCKLKVFGQLEACGDSSVVRQILVDGIDVALQHGGKRRLSPAGIALAVAHFMELSFPVRVVIPHWLAHDADKHPHLFAEPPQLLIRALREDDLLVVLPDPDEASWRPSLSSFRTVRDVERTIDLCKTFNAAFCSNDFSQFLHMMVTDHEQNAQVLSRVTDEREGPQSCRVKGIRNSVTTYIFPPVRACTPSMAKDFITFLIHKSAVSASSRRQLVKNHKGAMNDRFAARDCVQGEANLLIRFFFATQNLEFLKK
ncbi:hypothetical protein Esti_000969 [Eimeria stiedai]